MRPQDQTAAYVRSDGRVWLWNAKVQGWQSIGSIADWECSQLAKYFTLVRREALVEV